MPMTQSDPHHTRPTFKDALALIQNEMCRLTAIRPPLKAANQPLDGATRQWMEEIIALQDQLQKLCDGSETPQNIINTIRNRQHLTPPPSN